MKKSISKGKFARMGALFQVVVHVSGFNLWALSQVLGIGYWVVATTIC
jgi:hypothetical protein